MVGDPERLDLRAQELVVGDHADDVHVELAAAVAPQQVEQAVILARGHQRDPLAAVAGVGRSASSIAKRLGERAERGLERGAARARAPAGRRPMRMKNVPRSGSRRVLVAS